MEEQLYSPDGDSISCFIHIYILIFIFICIVLNPPVLWNACSAFWGDISFSWGYWGYVQHWTAGKSEKKKRQRVRKETSTTHFTPILVSFFVACTHLFYCLTPPPPRMPTDWLFWKSPAPERLTLGWVGEATGGWPGLIGLAVKEGNIRFRIVY